MWGGLVVICVLWGSVACIPSQIAIGGLFHPESRLHQHIVFKYAVDRINMDNAVLPHSKLVPIVANVSYGDSYNTGRRLCDITSEGVAAIFGPQTGNTAGIVRSVCDNMEIPNIQTFWDPEPKPARCLLNLYPDAATLAKAYREVLENLLHWKSYVILYEEDEGLMRIQEILKAKRHKDSRVTVRQLEAGKDNRPLLKAVKASLEVHIILDCAIENIQEILRQAKEVKLAGEYFSFLLISLDTHTVDLSEFDGTAMNITALRLLNPAREAVQYAVEDWVEGERRYGHKLDIKPGTVRTETALMNDAVHLFARALHQLDPYITIKPLSCNGVDTWAHGFALRNYMKVMQFNGMTGLVKLDEDGRRTDFNLDIIEYSNGAYKEIGTWDPRIGVNSTRDMKALAAQITSSLRSKTLIVSSRIGGAFLAYNKSCVGCTGNDQYEGYSIELIQAIAKDLDFKFEIHLAADKSYGSLNPITKKWDGLIKDLLDRTADLGICDLTITFERESVVDFTMPFMTLGISILFSVPANTQPSLFSFLDPLSIDVWLYMATAYLGVSVVLFILARASSTEWSSSHPCLNEPQEMENKLSMLNSLWAIVGSLMQQGSDIAPQAVSTRMVAGMWWFFTLIMISSYTANLAASLTVTRMDASIENVEDLAKQTKIKYGAYKGGSTTSFFEKSNHSTYQRIWTTMSQARPKVFVDSNDEGVERVKKGKRMYAFFMESVSIEYITERNCDLMQIGGLLDSKGYGIAMPQNSPYRTDISGAVLKLQENGGLDKLKRRWWKELHGGNACKKIEVVDSNKLGLDAVGGVFIVLACGCATAFVVSIVEMLWNCRKIAVEEGITPWEALVLEIKFAVRMSETKPVRKRPDLQPDKNETSSFIRLDLDQYPNK